ncbi:MAG TPA: winged helix-turn-helix transcriptional regulator [Candidatus Thermoplasmatota archaeon]|nr:winged helix-turn-helix transcriptional regulator [Candidatus Thermoplasmatota archaeon]
MKGVHGIVEIEVSMRVEDVLALIARRYGSVSKLRKHLDKHAEEDRMGYLLWDTADRHGGEPDLTVRLGQIMIGDLEEILVPSKLNLLSVLMARPGVGVRELARSIKKNPATVLEQIAQLEEAGLVIKESGGPGKPAVIRPLATELTIRVSTKAET